MRVSGLIREFAIGGAKQRLNELRQEERTILKAFPELGPVNGTPPERRRRKLSAKARKAISMAQKARWAKQRSKNA